MTPAGLTIDPVDRLSVTSRLQGLDTSFETDAVYHVDCATDSLQLQLVAAASRIHKRFLIDPDQPIWDRGFVATIDDRPCGFIATRFEAWNRRLVIVHFYVDLPYRQQGIGRRLLEHAMEEGRAAGAQRAWVETSNVNHPGIVAYQRLGFSLCGCDLTLYQGTPCADEFAIYLSCSLA